MEREEGLGRRAPDLQQRQPAATGGDEASAAAGGPSVRDIGKRILEVESNSVLVATIVLIGFIGVMHPDFLSWGQLKEVVQNSVYQGRVSAKLSGDALSTHAVLEAMNTDALDPAA